MDFKKMANFYSFWPSIIEFNRPSVRNAILFAALAGFSLGLYLAIANQPGLFKNLDWKPAAVVVVIGVPASLLLNVIEFMLMARIVGRSTSALRAFEITTIGTAANMLPLPGGTIVRIAALKGMGASIGGGVSVTLLISGMWLAVALSYAGIWISLSQESLIGVMSVVSGLVLFGPVFIALRRLDGGWKNPLLVTIVKLFLVISDAVRIYLCFIAIGTAASFAQASALTVASVVGSTVSIVPAGLGIREVVAVAISPTVGMLAAPAFLATAANRILGLSTIMPIAGLLLIFSHFREKSVSRAK